MGAAAEPLHEDFDDLGDVRGKLQELAREGRIDELIELVIDLLARVRTDNNKLAGQLKIALRMMYGAAPVRRSAELSSR